MYTCEREGMCVYMIEAMCVCWAECMYACDRKGMCADMIEGIHIRENVCMYVCMYVCMCKWEKIRVSLCLYILTRVIHTFCILCMCTCACIL